MKKTLLSQAVEVITASAMYSAIKAKEVREKLRKTIRAKAEIKKV